MTDTIAETTQGANDLHILCWDDDRIDRYLAEQVAHLPGVGYYGPTKAQGMHQDYRLCETPEEALALANEHWGKRECPWMPQVLHWRDGHGPVEIPNYADDAGDALRLASSCGCRFCLTRDDDYWRCTALPTKTGNGKCIIGFGGHRSSAAKAICYALIDMTRSNP